MRDLEDRGPGVLIFPPVLFALTLAGASLLQWLFPLPFWQATWSRRILGALLFLAALVFARWGERTMHRAGTNVRPDRPATAIVEDGPFRYTRNPLYLGVTAMFVGVAQMANSAWFLLVLVPMLVVLHFGVVRREERYLEAKFGEPYRAYRERVRRYL
ncbi:MAG TPA: isoprenylcysteine carboxylmethyltransferase family protein [Candidatus Polarisedimenticolaceae bacterium]|nr:isoprenylcysteine carboxylmethyltransferase family protein [Candidatus Polarisedimenticolaceae bacterium]